MRTIEKTSRPPASLRDAVELAKRYLEEVSDEPLTNLRMEEVERDKKDAVWRITLGYDTAKPATPEPQNSFSALLREKNVRRIYRVIGMEESTGEFLSVKLRDL